MSNGGGKRKAPSDAKDKVKKIKLDITAQSDARKKYDPSRQKPFDPATRKKKFEPNNKYESKKKFDSSRKSLVSKDESDDENDSASSDAEDGGAALKGRTMKPLNGANGKSSDRGVCP